MAGGGQDKISPQQSLKTLSTNKEEELSQITIDSSKMKLRSSSNIVSSNINNNSNSTGSSTTINNNTEIKKMLKDEIINNNDSSNSKCNNKTTTTNNNNNNLSIYSLISTIIIASISYYTFLSIQDDDITTTGTGTTTKVQHVWFYGWVTALSTGLGVIPFVFFSQITNLWIDIFNASAAGMMIAASMCLLHEGYTQPQNVSDHDNNDDDTFIVNNNTSSNSFNFIFEQQQISLFLGFMIGIFFILSTKSILDKYEYLKFEGLTGIESRKVLLIILVMTLHSFSEGVGIGVSFGGTKGTSFGAFISTSLAVHNVPEGLAVALILIPKGISILDASLWNIFTSLPQPIMAVPAFLFVEFFSQFLSMGLGFAAGAMLYVACFELLIEAMEHSSKLVVGMTTFISFIVMMSTHIFLREAELST